MGQRHGIDDALLAAAEEIRAKLRRASRTARGEDHEGASSGHDRHGDRGASVIGGVADRARPEPVDETG